jgi:hypothetical protein
MEIISLMKTKTCIFVIVCKLFICPAYSDSGTEWNPSLSETQKVDILKQIELHRIELRAKRPPYTVISIRGIGSPPSPRCNIGIFGNTNLIAYKPLSSQAFDMHLFKIEGDEILKTSYGHQFGQKLEPDKKLLDGTFRNDPAEMYGHSRMLHFDTGDGDSHFWDFDVLKSFRIKEPGEYRLQVEVRLFTKDTNGVFQPFILPPVETKVNISESDLGK